MCLHYFILCPRVAPRVPGHTVLCLGSFTVICFSCPLAELNICGDLNAVWGPLLKGRANDHFLQIIRHIPSSHTGSETREGGWHSPGGMQFGLVNCFWIFCLQPILASPGLSPSKLLILWESNAEDILLSFHSVLLGRVSSSLLKKKKIYTSLECWVHFLPHGCWNPVYDDVSCVEGKA